MLSAFLAVEDEQYYLHHGVNLRGFARALLSNFSSDAPRQGASTISQQVVKNEFLAGLPRDGRYKGLQAHYATMLEKKMSKDEILERYLNTVFFGNNAYGLQAAAEVYFGKNVGELTMIEGAFLAGLVRSPSGFDPIRHSERARARFRQVTERLADVGLVTPLVAALLGATWKMPERVRTIPTYTTKPTYYTEAIKEYLLQAGDVPRRRAAARQPAVPRRTVDPFDVRSQPAGRSPSRPASNCRRTRKGFDAAMVTLDTKTGAIRAMVGGHGFQPRVDEINMALVPRQTGSSIKIFILAAALAGRRRADRRDRRDDAVHASPTRTIPKRSVPHQRRDQSRCRAVAGTDVALDQLRVRPPVADRRVASGRRHDLSHGGVAVPVPGSDRPGSRSSRSHRSPPAPTRCARSTWQRACRRSPTRVCTTTRTTSTTSTRADGTRLYTHEDPGVQVLDPGVALTEVATLKGVLTQGHRPSLAGRLPVPGCGQDRERSRTTPTRGSSARHRS